MSIFFDPEDNFETYRRNLPHRRQAGAIYFVTFHLADSLPTKKLVALEKEKKLWLVLNPPLHNPRQIEEYHRNFSHLIQKWLDAGHGSCALARPQVFRFVASVLNFFNAQRYELGEHVVMPRERTKNESSHISHICLLRTNIHVDSVAATQAGSPCYIAIRSVERCLKITRREVREPTATTRWPSVA
jgi:hypothetical protein